ncbi:MAG: endonuclease/exonuclease/phosphatase family protein [Actinomycetales bacterium]|nr:endonuclease/exonuclease/phosphatase family protein [Actinomycetales bacterium]
MLRLATWNVLAPAYALPHRYAGVAPDDLAPETRTPRVHARLRELLAECDVVAVQEADADLVEWLRDVVRASVVHAPRTSSSDGVLLASTSRDLDGETGATSDGRRTWASARVGRVLVVSVHLDPEWPARHLAGVRQAQEVVRWVDRTAAATAVVLGDINAAWSSRTGDVLRRGGFEAVPAGSTAATNGRCRELDVVAVRGAASVVLTPAGLPPVGSGLWLPDAAIPSDHAPLRAEVR